MKNKIVPHSFHLLKGHNWSYCINCGLLRLKNKITEWCVKNGCDYAEHPEYKKKLKQFTKNNSKLDKLYEKE